MGHLEALKLQLQLEETTTELWSIQQRIHRFENLLNSNELHYSHAHAQLLRLEEQQVIYNNSFD